MKRVAERIKALEAIDSTQMAESAHIFINSLRDRSPTVRGLAVELIGENEITEALREVLPLANDRDSEVRALAINCIAQISDRDFPSKTVASRLFDKDELVRVAAAEALAEHGNASVLDSLRKALMDASPIVRSYVAEAIGAIGDKKSIPDLERQLNNEKNERALLGCYVGLSLLDGRNVLQNLIDLFHSDDYGVRSAVINSLDQIYIQGEDIHRVHSFLTEALKNEETIAVKSSIEKALKSFKG